jgi:hypothetical protein
MSLIVPSWFKHRQGKAEEVAPNIYRLSAPQMPESFVAIRQADDGKWSAALRTAADGPDVAATDATFENPGDAWTAAFELHRLTLVY